ncbi:MAG: hypothetical protein PW843_15885 [Azospirillaceae bacterium]|nr:hypothetical protein [Azospirillaceae bacterium]
MATEAGSPALPAPLAVNQATAFSPAWQGGTPKGDLKVLTRPGPDVLLRITVGAIRNPSDIGLGLRLFLNQPDATAATPDTAPGYLGNVAFFPSSPPAGAPPQSFVINLRTALAERGAETLRRLAKAPPRVTVILVPLTNGQARADAASAQVTGMTLELQKNP